MRRPRGPLGRDAHRAVHAEGPHRRRVRDWVASVGRARAAHAGATGRIAFDEPRDRRPARQPVGRLRRRRSCRGRALHAHDERRRASGRPAAAACTHPARAGPPRRAGSGIRAGAGRDAAPRPPRRGGAASRRGRPAPHGGPHGARREVPRGAPGPRRHDGTAFAPGARHPARGRRPGRCLHRPRRKTTPRLSARGRSHSSPPRPTRPPRCPAGRRRRRRPRCGSWRASPGAAAAPRGCSPR